MLEMPRPRPRSGSAKYDFYISHFFHIFFFFSYMSVTPLAEGTIPSEIGFPANSPCSQAALSIQSLEQSDGFDSLIIKAGSAFYCTSGHVEVE